MFFDSHCHLTSEQLAPDFAGLLERAKTQNVSGFLNIGDDLTTSRRALEQAQEAQSQGAQMWSSAGVHPQNALSWNPYSRDELRALVTSSQVVAIGEIGLDFVYDEAHPQHPGARREVQQDVLRAQLQLALELKLPVVLHNREADDALLAVVAEFSSLRGVFHCFGSDADVARHVLEMGFHLGFTGLVTFKNAESVRDVARICPLERMLIETDAPYLAPVPFRGKTNEPSYLPRVAETLAGLRNISVEEIGRITSENARRLFGLSA